MLRERRLEKLAREFGLICDHREFEALRSRRTARSVIGGPRRCRLLKRHEMKWMFEAGCHTSRGDRFVN